LPRLHIGSFYESVDESLDKSFDERFDDSLTTVSHKSNVVRLDEIGPETTLKVWTTVLMKVLMTVWTTVLMKGLILILPL
jgi:hypothetical protein